ncbi:MAG: hypothetical protein GY765_36490, partial [bacterium]|nr:hypothetical protein [bacterium]
IGIDDNFFAIGGHSLKATRVTTRIHKELEVQLPLAELFKRPTIREQADYISNSAAQRFSGIPIAPKQEFYPATPAQERFFLLQQMAPHSIAFNMPYFAPLPKEADTGKLEHTFNALVTRHEALRTSFHLEKETLVQKIHPPLPVTIADYSLKDSKGEAASFIRPFDLSRAPLLRVAIMETADSQSWLFVDMHHIISDGTSQDILMRDFAALHRGEELAKLRLQYKDYAYWRVNGMDSPAMKAHEAYWLERLSGPLPLLDLPTDFTRPPQRNHEGDAIEFSMGEPLAEAVRQLVSVNETTLYIVLLAAFNVLLYWSTGQEDIIIGSTTAGRTHEDIQDIIGLVIGGVMMRNFPVGDKPFNRFLKEITADTLEDFQHQEYPVEMLVNKVAAHDIPGRNPITDITLILQNMVERANVGHVSTSPAAGASPQPGEPSHVETPDKKENPYANAPVNAKVDVTLSALEAENDILFRLEYGTALYKKETMQRWGRWFVSILQQVTRTPAISICEIDLVETEEKAALMGDVEKFHPLSHPQQRIYYTEKRYEGSAVNNVLYTAHFPRILDEELLEKAVNIVVRQNDGLRLRIVEFRHGNRPYQYVAPYAPFTLDRQIFSGPEAEAALEQWLEQEALRALQFDNSGLFHCTYFRRGEEESGFTVKIHHVITDVWTILLLIMEDTVALYNRLEAGEEITIPRPSYLGFPALEREYLLSEQARSDREFWHDLLLPPPEPIDITGRKSPAVSGSIKAEAVTLPFPDEVRTLLHAFRNNS